MTDRTPRTPMAPPTTRGHFGKAMTYALSGLAYAVRTQRNLRIELGFAVAALALSYLLDVTRVEFCVVLVLIGAVLAAEMFNTSIEAIVDIASPEKQPLAKAAKDSAAGAVLVLAAVSLFIGIAMFWPRIVERLS